MNDFSKMEQGRAFTIAITSGKGGVGKTSVALNLAVQLARLETKVLLIDADMGLANLSVLLGIYSGNTLEDVIEDRCGILDAMVDGPEGIVIVPAASGTGRRHIFTAKGRETLRKELSRLENGFDLFLIDTGPGMSPNVMESLSCADEILVITTPEPTAIADAYAMIKVISNTISRSYITLLINMVKSAQEAEDLKEKFDQIVERFLRIQVEGRGYISLDRNVAEAVLRQVPFVIRFPDSPASRCVAELARRILLSMEKIPISSSRSNPM